MKFLAANSVGKQTVKLNNAPSVIATASIVGPKEGQGPLGQYFDKVLDDDLYGEKSWEKAEAKFFQEAVEKVIIKGHKDKQEINYLLGGDLLNQLISSDFAARQLGIPFFGLYGACSTMSEAMALGAMLVDGGYADNVVCAASSHFSTAERQYRFPLELGVQRPPTAHWTVTGAGAALVSNQGEGPYITMVTVGKVVDMGIKDSNDMGSAMAPAAADTIIAHFIDTGLTPNDYDLIITGDLGRYGKDIADELVKKAGYDISAKHFDCGVEIFSPSQDPHAGGSGCGCSACVLAAYLIPHMWDGTYNSMLFLATGALLSPTSSQQGESIPGIAHAVSIHRTK
ncbi:stage V sporulation protein AD [Mahella australiensis 50-1 BON]|uniref:Stage V sporulation protein AD n=1 Tax=Mahella australiensis (strain DSM 15567 / CIP 107919 / 50-1 BON) TaxID=697281 RepID=F3ZVK7_MAHA5|nr:stage V sporulation protein AD [Mahella australiensis 50-1 BON]